MKWIRSTAAPAALSLVLALTACGEPAEEEPVQEPAPATEAPATEPAEGMEAPDAPVDITLSAVGESGVSGQATAVHQNDSVTVSIDLQGLPGEGEYAAHIHQGSCEAGGGVAAPLNSVQGTADGSGQSTTTLAASALEADQTYFVQVHGPGGVLACGDIEGHQGGM